MEAVWVAGCSSYETTGVIHLLREGGISAGLFRPGERLRTRDTLILCFSSAPLLGWWRYLKITQWVMHRYDIRLIVLCPDEVYRAGGFAPIFPDICYHLTHYKPAAADIPVASDNPAHYADAIRYNARTPLQGSLLPLTRLVWA